MNGEMPAELAAAVDSLERNEVSTQDAATVESLVTKMMDLQDRKEAIESMLKAVNAELDDVRKRRLPDKMAELGMVKADGHGSFTHSSGASVSLRVQLWASIPKKDDRGNPTDAFEDAVYGWLEAHGHAGLIKRTVHPQTFSAFIRELVEDGAELPPGVKHTMETMAVIRRPKGGKDA